MNFYLLLEDGVSKIILEDSSGDILLEDGIQVLTVIAYTVDTPGRRRQ